MNSLFVFDIHEANAELNLPVVGLKCFPYTMEFPITKPNLRIIFSEKHQPIAKRSKFDETCITLSLYFRMFFTTL